MQNVKFLGPVVHEFPLSSWKINEHFCPIAIL